MKFLLQPLLLILSLCSVPSFAQGADLPKWVIVGDSVTVGFCARNICKGPSYAQIVNSTQPNFDLRNVAYASASAGGYSADYGLTWMTMQKWTTHNGLLSGYVPIIRLSKEIYRAVLGSHPLAGMIIAVGGADVQGLGNGKKPCVNYYGLLVCTPAPPEEYQEDLIQMIKWVRDYEMPVSDTPGPIFLVSPYPRPGYPPGTPVGDRLLAYRQKQADICNGVSPAGNLPNVFCADAYSVVNPDIHYDPEDILHPNQAGHAAIAGAVNKAITEAGY